MHFFYFYFLFPPNKPAFIKGKNTFAAPELDNSSLRYQLASLWPVLRLEWCSVGVCMETVCFTAFRTCSVKPLVDRMWLVGEMQLETLVQWLDKPPPRSTWSKAAALQPCVTGQPQLENKPQIILAFLHPNASIFKTRATLSKLKKCFHNDCFFNYWGQILRQHMNEKVSSQFFKEARFIFERKQREANTV